MEGVERKSEDGEDVSGIQTSNDVPEQDDALVNPVGTSPDTIADTNQSLGDVSLPSSSLNRVGGAPTIFRIKFITWQAKKCPIILQNINGPCPLISISNVLSLRGILSFSPTTRSVTTEKLVELIAEIVVESSPEGLRNANFEQNVQDALDNLAGLSEGLTVNVRFGGVKQFEPTGELAIFDVLKITLYHGWIAHGVPKTQNIIGNMSYNQLTEKICGDVDSGQLETAEIAQNFLSSTASQMTYEGLCELNETMVPSELAVLFRNNHFSTIVKMGDKLFILVTDQGFLVEPNIVWETLTNIEGDGTFVDGFFQKVPPKVADNKSYPPVSTTSYPPASVTSCPEDIMNQIDQDYLVAMSLENEFNENKIVSETMWDDQMVIERDYIAGDEALARRLQENEEEILSKLPALPNDGAAVGGRPGLNPNWVEPDKWTSVYGAGQPRLAGPSNEVEPRASTSTASPTSSGHRLDSQSRYAAHRLYNGYSSNMEAVMSKSPCLDNKFVVQSLDWYDQPETNDNQMRHDYSMGTFLQRMELEVLDSGSLDMSFEEFSAPLKDATRLSDESSSNSSYRQWVTDGYYDQQEKIQSTSSGNTSQGLFDDDSTTFETAFSDGETKAKFLEHMELEYLNSGPLDLSFEEFVAPLKNAKRLSDMELGISSSGNTELPANGVVGGSKSQGHAADGWSTVTTEQTNGSVDFFGALDHVARATSWDETAADKFSGALKSSGSIWTNTDESDDEWQFVPIYEAPGDKAVEPVGPWFSTVKAATAYDTTLEVGVGVAPDNDDTDVLDVPADGKIPDSESHGAGGRSLDEDSFESCITVYSYWTDEDVEGDSCDEVASLATDVSEPMDDRSGEEEVFFSADSDSKSSDPDGEQLLTDTTMNCDSVEEEFWSAVESPYPNEQLLLTEETIDGETGEEKVSVTMDNSDEENIYMDVVPQGAEPADGVIEENQ